MSTKKTIIQLIGIIVILLLFIVLSMTVGHKFINGKSIESSISIENQRSDEVNYGNNILSGGYVAKQGKWIYYRNLSEKSVLYKVKEDGNNKTKLTDNMASCINIIDEWIYYVSSDGIYKVKINGAENTKIRDLKDDNKYKTHTLFNDLSSYKNEFYNLYVLENRIYFIDSTRGPMDDGYKMLISIDTEGKNEKLHNTGTNITGFIIQNGFIYYWGSFHIGGLYKMKLDDSNKATLTKLFITNISVFKTQFYFTSFDFDNPKVNQKIFKTEDEFITNKILQIPSAVRCMNVIRENIYYCTLENSKALCKANLDGSNIVEVCTLDNEISNISFDGQWVYFVSNALNSQGTSKSTMYRMKPDGKEIKTVD